MPVLLYMTERYVLIFKDNQIKMKKKAFDKQIYD